MTTPENYWDSHYSSPTGPNFLEVSPSKFLFSCINRLQPGKLLEPACGVGQNLELLSKYSFQCLGIDVSEVALAHTRGLLAKQPSNAIVELKKADLELFVFGLMEYDSIVMTQFKPKSSRVFHELLRSLKQGGTILIESYLIDELKKPLLGDDEHLDCYFRPNELLRDMNGMRILFYQEGFVDGHHRVQCLAQKPLDRDMQKFGSSFQAAVDSKGPVKKSAQMELAESLFKKS